MKSEDLKGVIKRMVIFWDLALWSVAAVRVNTSTRLHGITSQRTAVLEEGQSDWGKQYPSFKFTHAHICISCSHVLHMYYDHSVSCHIMKNFSRNDFAWRSKSQSEKGSFKLPFINGIYLKGGSWNNWRFSCYPYCQFFVFSKLVLLIPD